MLKNRELIYSIIKSEKHLTADEIYERTKAYTKMVYATVYNSLAYLVKKGLVRRIIMPNVADRYDANMIAHDHFVCKQCGKVYDVLPQSSRLCALDDGSVIEESEIIYKGICSNCIKG